MTSDNTPAKPIEERFAIALAELVGMCLAADMHPASMIPPMKKQLAAIQYEAMPSKADEAAMDPWRRVNEAELRRALMLEPTEPLPPYRD